MGIVTKELRDEMCYMINVSTKFRNTWDRDKLQFQNIIPNYTLETNSVKYRIQERFSSQQFQNHVKKYYWNYVFIHVVENQGPITYFNKNSIVTNPGEGLSGDK